MMKKRMTKFICLLLVLVLAMSALAACGNKNADNNSGNSTNNSTDNSTDGSEDNTAESGSAESTKPTTDREGNAISIPEEVNRIVSLAPATTQILEAVGVKDKIVGIDSQTPYYVQGMDSIPQFDMMEPDVEKIAELEPDVVFTTGMSYIAGDPYSALVDMGVCVVVIPSSVSIEGVKEDVVFTAECVSAEAGEKAKAIVDEMQAQIDEIAAIGATITEKKTVMFEISALPAIYSFGKGTFLDEMISIVGAENVFSDQEGWIPVAEEDAVKANPDVILTSVNYLGTPEDSVNEILGRTGWESVNAIANKEVYYIDNASSSLPNQYIIKALQEMAEAIYPEVYAELDLAA